MLQLDKKILIRYRKVLKKKFNIINTQFQDLKEVSFSPKLLGLNIRVRSNNIFCSLVDKLEPKVLQIASSGKYNVKVSQKNVKSSTVLIVKEFLKNITIKTKDSSLVVAISCPKKMRKRLILQISNGLLTLNTLVFKVNAKKCFNGCRVKKKKRKKQKGLRIFK